MTFMDATQILTGLAIGSAIGGVIGFVLANTAARARTAGFDAMREECETLRIENKSVRDEASASKALLEASQQYVRTLQEEIKSEREKVTTATATASESDKELSRINALFKEKCASLVELRTTVEQSRLALTDVFKATGADLLKATTETFMAQAKQQFESQSQLSQQDLESRQKAFDATLTPFKDQIVKQEKLINELDLKRGSDATAFTEQFRQIADLQKTASDSAQRLASVMRDNRQRGKWGETQLINIVELAGMRPHIDYNEQASVEGEEGRIRPDVTINLPGKRVVPIDAKVPMDAYLDSLNPEKTDSERAARRIAYPNAVRSHVKALVKRDYARAVGADIEITIMFVPVESALSVALEIDGGLFEDALKDGIIITTPSTLLALLRICALQWKQAAVTENVQKIGEGAKELLDRIITFAGHLESVGEGIKSASNAFNKSVGSYNTRLLPGAKDIAKLSSDLKKSPAELEEVLVELRTDIKKEGDI